MNESQKLQLNKIIQQNNVQDVTDEIRDKKHSDLIKNDILKYLSLKKQYSRLKKEQFNSIVNSKCSFIQTHYTDLFNKIKSGDLNMTIMWEFLNILKLIETNKINQHEGAYKVGELLKSIYIDSALRKGDKLDEKHKKKDKKVKKISYSKYKEKFEK